MCITIYDFNNKTLTTKIKRMVTKVMMNRRHSIRRPGNLNYKLSKYQKISRKLAFNFDNQKL